MSMHQLKPIYFPSTLIKLASSPSQLTFRWNFWFTQIWEEGIWIFFLYLFITYFFTYHMLSVTNYCQMPESEQGGNSEAVGWNE